MMKIDISVFSFFEWRSLASFQSIQSKTQSNRSKSTESTWLKKLLPRYRKLQNFSCTFSHLTPHHLPRTKGLASPWQNNQIVSLKPLRRGGPSLDHVCDLWQFVLFPKPFTMNLCLPYPPAFVKRFRYWRPLASSLEGLLVVATRGS